MQKHAQKLKKHWKLVIITILFLISIPNWFFNFYSWEGIFYRYGNYGHWPETQGYYSSKEDCLEQSQIILKAKSVEVDGKPAEDFFCGRRCSTFFDYSINNITSSGSDDPPRFEEPNGLD